MLCEYSHTKSESLTQIRTAVAEIQHFFLGVCFLLVHPVHISLNRLTSELEFCMCTRHDLCSPEIEDRGLGLGLSID